MTTTTTEAYRTHGLSVGHSCNDCFQLRITPAVVHTAGPNYEPVASIEAGHGADEDSQGRGQVDVLIDDLPGAIAELQRIYDEGKDATEFPPGWLVRD